MKKGRRRTEPWWCAGVSLLLAVSQWAAAAPPDPGAAPERQAAGRLGTVAVYAPEGSPASVVVLVSGDGGWDAEADDLARKLKNWGALVAGVSGPAYVDALRLAGDGCRDMTVDVLGLTGALATRAALPSSMRPILVGYGTGAALAYAMAAQAPDGSFGAIITQNFCSDVPARLLLCRGAGLDTAPARDGSGSVYRPRSTLTMPWAVLQGARDKACSAGTVPEFLAGVPSAKLVPVPDMSHGLAGQEAWLQQFRDAYLKLATRNAEHRTLDAAVDDLPVIEVRATGTPAAAHRNDLLVLLTGDGGWAGLDRELSASVAAQGVPVVALSTLQYFWKARRPEQAALDIDRIIRHYTVAWHRDRVLLVGYSFGANILPLVVPRLPPATRASLASVSLLAPALHAALEVRVADWLPGSVPVGESLVPALPRLQGTPVLCLYGQEEKVSLCQYVLPSLGRRVALPGSHHFNVDSATLARQILDFRG